MKKVDTNRTRTVLISGFLIVALVAGCTDEIAPDASVPATGQASEPASGFQQREVTLAVPDMSCPMCPITVRKALAGVDGVLQAEASLDDKQARVVFDPAKANIDGLVAAVAEAGFTATPNTQTDE